MFLHIAFPRGPFQLSVILEQRKGFGIIGMGVQIQPQLQEHKVQRPQLVQRSVGDLAGIDL